MVASARRILAMSVGALLIVSAPEIAWAGEGLSTEGPVLENVEKAVDAAPASGAEFPGDSVASVLDVLKRFPMVGQQGAALLDLAQQSLGINLTNLEMRKIIPMLADLQKNVHAHYLLTKGSGETSKPSTLMQRVLKRTSKSNLLRSLKKFAPNTDDAELLQQLDVVTQLLHEIHTNPENSMTEVLKKVASAVGFDLTDEEVDEIQSQMKWAQEMLAKLIPNLPNLLGKNIGDEL